MSSIPVIEFVEVSKNFTSGEEEIHILEGGNLQIFAGETVAIVGPSGSGKSTLLNLIAGLDRISSGTIKVSGEESNNWNEDQLSQWRRQQVGFIFQDFRLINSFTALENVTLPLEILGHSVSEAKQRAEELLKKLGLGQRYGHFPTQLSGGEQQRVAIARAYAHHPKLILADEPTGNLDPDTSEIVLTTLLQMNQDSQTTLVLVTHDQSIAKRMSRQISIVNRKITHV